MAQNNINLKAGTLFKQCVMNVNITHLKGLKFKIKIGIFLIKLACLFMGCGIKFYTEEESK